jgi:carbon starvation protein CstA
MCEHYVVLCEYYEFLLIYVFCVIVVYYFCCTWLPIWGHSQNRGCIKK